MPSQKDPNQVQIGSGKSDRSSVLFAVSSASGFPIAQEVDVVTPPTMDGENVQEIIDEYWALIPDRPNFIDEYGGSQFNSTNPVGWTFNESHTSGFFEDVKIATSAIITDTATFDVDVTLFPADRGILAVKIVELSETHVSALDLGGIFTEGNVFSQSVPARILAQNDYTAGSDSAGDVDALPQNVDLVSRVPMERDYASSAYPGTLYPFDDYRDDFQTFQIARATITIDLSSFTNVPVEVKIVHYKDKAAFDAFSTSASDVYAIADLGTIHNDTYGFGTTTFYYDDGTGDALSLTSSTYAPSAGLTTPTSTYELSGVGYYSSSDTYDLDWEAEGVWDNSFLNEGADFRFWEQNTDADIVPIQYTDYDLNDIEPDGDPAVYSQAGLSVPGGSSRIGEAQPSITVKDPTGGTVTDVFNSNTYLWSLYGGGNELTVENFRDETGRYPQTSTLGSTNFLPDGSTSSFSSSDPLTDTGELQVRGVSLGGNYELAEGGELGYPNADYSTGYAPTLGGAQPNYSAISYDGAYITCLDFQEASLTGKMTLKGQAGGTDIWDDIEYDGSSSYEGHSAGISVEIAAPGDPGATWRDIGREYGDGNGAALSHTVISPEELEIEFKLDVYPQKNSGFFPVVVRVKIFNGSPSQLDFVLYQIALTATS